MNQVVMDMEIKLVVAGLVACAASLAGTAATNGNCTARARENCHEIWFQPTSMWLESVLK